VSNSEKSHPQNVAGPFYVVLDCCTACGVPEAVAPELFAYDAANHCYVKRQPISDGEVARALHVIRGQELGCIRYGGTEKAILHRLAEAGESAQCDHPLEGVEPVLRNTVTFTARHAESVTLDEFVDHIRRVVPWVTIRTKKTTASVSSLLGLSSRSVGESMALAWFEDRFHELTLSKPTDSGDVWMIQHRGPLGLSEWLDRWLSEASRYEHVLWYSEHDWTQRRNGQRHPW